MKGYKGFDKDLRCRGFQYEIGKSYHQDGEIVACGKGFHFCDNLADCFYFYDKFDSRFCEVEASGDADRKVNKIAASDIKIIRELSRTEINRAIYGYGYGDGYGDGYGYGYGDGYGDGYGYGYGDGYGYGYGDGYGYGYGYGDGDGYGYGYGYGYGDGSGYGYGDGYGYGYGYGYGDGRNIQKILNYTEDIA